MPKGVKYIPITVKGANGDMTIINAVVNNLLPLNNFGFNENNGYVSMEAAHYTRALNSNNVKWQIIPNYGRTLSGVMPKHPVTSKIQIPGGNSPHLEYVINMIDTGWVNVKVYLSPTLDFTNSGGLHYAISIDDEGPRIVNINTDEPKTWNKDVSDNIKIQASRISYYPQWRACSEILDG